MNPCSLDMLHDAANDDIVPISEGVDVHFDGVIEKFIDEHRVLGRS